MTPQLDTLEKIRQCCPPSNKKKLRSFLGLTGWYQKFIPNYSKITSSLTDLLRRGSPNKLRWESKHQVSFELLKRSITSSPILRTPDFARPFVVQTDASDTAVGAALLQFSNGLFPVAFASRKLQPRETRYSVIERECLAVVFAIKIFERELYGKEFQLCTDHSSLQYLQKKSPDNARLLRWSVFLQNFAFVIKAIPEKENVLSDFLIRM